MEEAAVHRSVTERADGAGVAVGKDGFGTVAIADLAQARGDGVESFVPAYALEGVLLLSSRQRSLGNAGLALERVQDAFGRVDAVEVLGNFAAEKALGHGLCGVAGHFD